MKMVEWIESIFLYAFVLEDARDFGRWAAVTPPVMERDICVTPRVWVFVAQDVTLQHLFSSTSSFHCRSPLHPSPNNLPPCPLLRFESVTTSTYVEF